MLQDSAANPLPGSRASCWLAYPSNLVYQNRRGLSLIVGLIGIFVLHYFGIISGLVVTGGFYLLIGIYLVHLLKAWNGEV